VLNNEQRSHHFQNGQLQLGTRAPSAPPLRILVTGHRRMLLVSPSSSSQRGKNAARGCTSAPAGVPPRCLALASDPQRFRTFAGPQAW
jgi:hypothetical protein